MPPKKDPTPPYIEGPKMDWSMDDGLYSRFQDWKLECELILDGELAEVAEARKVNMLIRWAGPHGIKHLKVWQKDKTTLTLKFIWKEFEAYCKPHSNELRARYELFKQLSQGTTPCDDWYTTVQNQLTMCNYQAQTESVLQRDIFLFGLTDQAFISKIISEESPDVTAATIRHKLKKLEAGRATAKYIKTTAATGKDPTAENVNLVRQHGNPKAKGQKRKGGWHKDSHPQSQSHPAKKPFQPKPQHGFKPNHQRGQPQGQGQNQQKPKPQQSSTSNICKRCGDTRHRQGFNCPASKYQCRKCHRYGHFTSKCMTQPQNANVNTVEEVNAAFASATIPPEFSADDSLDAMYICPVNTSKPKRRVFADLQIADSHSTRPKFLKVRLDTAADVSMMSKSVYLQLFNDPQCQKLSPVTTNTLMHDHTKAEVLGSATIQIIKDGKEYDITFQVVPYEASTLLSCEQVTALGLVQIPEQARTPRNALIYGSSVDIKYVNFLQRNKNKSNDLEVIPLTSLPEIKRQYKDIFEGIGTFPGEPYHINIDPNVPPKRLPCRPVPVHQQDEFKKQLNEMLAAGIIKEVHEATPWINSFVIVETVKDGKKKLRICLDPKPLNKAIIREPYVTRTPDDVYHKLANAKHITVIDFKKSFWQFLLDEISSFLTTFNTPFGRFRYTRIPFGASVSGDYHQRILDSIYGKLDNVIGIADDLIIWGNEADGSDHDRAFQAVLDLTRKNNLRLNIDKIQYCQQKVTFFGETYTVDGHRPLADKVEAITKMETPTSVTEVQRFLGMCNALSKFSPRMAELSEPLRQLTCKGVHWNWGPEHTQSFESLKREISTAPILKYYDPTKPVVLQTDACIKGLGAVLLQEEHPIYFASKSLTDAQRNYVAIELEALAVSWAVQKFHHYLYGTSFTLQTDQKPLQAILSKSFVEATPRMQRLLLPTIPYDMTVEYIKGSTNFIADCLSRAPVAKDTIKLPLLQVNQITAHARCTQDKLNKLRESTAKDDTLALLKHTVQHGWPQTITELPPELRPYWTFRDEITLEDGLLLKGERLIIPVSDQPEILDQLHHGHLGLQKCLSRARVTVYWPSINEQLKELVTNCTICLKHSAANHKNSAKIGPSLGQEVPSKPWVKLATDIFTFDNHNYLLVVDYTSRFPVIRRLTSMTARVVAEHLKAIFSELGVPDTLISDNGPCYTGEYFRAAMHKLGITHITTSPHHHQANGLAEGYVRIIKNLLSKAKETGEDYHEVISVYRTTPISGNLPSPFELLHNRKPNLDLPKWEKPCPVPLEHLKGKDKNPQAVHDNILPIGTNVMFITPPNKTWLPAKIKEYLGHRSYKIQTPDGVVYRRTRLHLKLYKPQQLKTVQRLPVTSTNARPQRNRRAPVKLDL